MGQREATAGKKLCCMPAIRNYRPNTLTNLRVTRPSHVPQWLLTHLFRRKLAHGFDDVPKGLFVCLGVSILVLVLCDEPEVPLACQRRGLLAVKINTRAAPCEWLRCADRPRSPIGETLFEQPVFRGSHERKTSPHDAHHRAARNLHARHREAACARCSCPFCPDVT